MTDRIPLTLVMVSYNKSDTIDLAIASAAEGSLKPDLIVISDDGSDDGTQSTAESHAKRWGIPHRVIRHQRVGRYRIQTMRNTCAANALDGVILLSDSDCIFGEHSLEAHYEIHRRRQWAIGTGPRFEFLEGSSGPFTSTFGTLEYTHYPHGHYCVPVGANYSFKKSLWKILGGFDRAFEGSYGMEEFQFSARAEQFGAVCVSDPLAYLFHIPHETVFGNRDASRNIAVFDDTYRRKHGDEEAAFLAKVIPHYWGGGRRTSVLGTLEALDEWGAPAGFVPPAMIQLSRTLSPLVEPAERCMADMSANSVARLGQFTRGLDWRRLPNESTAHRFLARLHGIAHGGRPAEETAQKLAAWLEDARAADRELAASIAGSVENR